MVADPRLIALQQAPKGGIAVEVGVHKGEYSDRILEVVQPRKLHLVDPWKLSADPAHATSWYGPKSSQAELDARHDDVVRKFADRIAQGVVEVHRGTSERVAMDFAEKVDLVYVDGDHTYDGVRTDLGCWWPQLNPGGVVIGDDYMLGKWWKDGVVRAFNEWIARPDVIVRWKMGTQIAIQKLPAAAVEAG